MQLKWTVILVVSAADQYSRQENFVLARQVGVPALVVFLNKVDQVDDEELLEPVKWKLEFIKRYEFR